jgi:hypothetical protein
MMIIKIKINLINGLKNLKRNKMNVIDIEKINQLISRTDISGNDKVKWLTDFIDGREFEQQERICDSEIIQRIRASKSDAEARRIIKTILKEIIL